MIEPHFALGSDFVKLIAEIDEFKGRWEALGRLSPDRLSALRRVAAIESIASSTRIEGATLTDAQVGDLLATAIQSQSFQSRDEQEVAGYSEAMDLVFEAFADMPLTENHICQLHQVLLRHSTKDERHRGVYKTIANDVVAFDDAGREIGTVFKTTSPFDTPREMEALVSWTRKSIDEGAHHPLITIAVFVVVFLAIHPFQDGNGRLSRILTSLLLLRSGYGYVPYASLERVIEDNKELYYRALRRTQVSLKGNAPDWQPWLGFFLRCLKKQKDSLSRRIELNDQTVDQTLSSLENDVLSLLSAHKAMSISEIAVLSGANRNTLKKCLRDLTADGRIRMHGKARATRYILSDR